MRDVRKVAHAGETPMSKPIARHAVVVGAGMGGVAAAKAVAPYFEKVTVLDRDVLPEGPAARVGTPQARHAHFLLAGGQKAEQISNVGREEVQRVERSRNGYHRLRPPDGHDEMASFGKTSRGEVWRHTARASCVRGPGRV